MAESKTIEIKVKWHKATEAPKKNVPIYLLFKVGKRKYPLCRLMMFRHGNVVPAEYDWGKTETQETRLPIMWAYASQIEPLITDEIVAEAKFAAWAWYKED